MPSFPPAPSSVTPVDLSWTKLQTGSGGVTTEYDNSGYNKANPYNYADLNVVTLTASGTVETAPTLIRCDCTSGAITVTLPYAQSCLGKIVYICKVDSGANTVSFAVNTGDNLWKPAALTTLTLQYQSCAFASIWDGTNNGWQCISAS